MNTSPTLSMARTCPYSPPAEHLRLQREEPVARVITPSGSEVWALTRLEDIRAMLTDPRFSSDRSRDGFPASGPGGRGFFGKPSMIGLDDPEHGEARRAVLGDFTIKRIASLRPRIQQIVDDCIDAMLAGPRPTDLVTALSLPVPSLVICEQLGVPYADHDFFQEHTTTITKRNTSMDDLRAAVDAIREYISNLIDAKRTEPGDDVLSRQLARGADHEDLVSLGLLLLVAGHETTANMISLGTMTLLDRPAALAAIREDPSRTLIAVEELLRYFTIAEFATARVAIEDAEIGGVQIKAGEGVITLANTANRDPDAFANPEDFDIERGDRHHVAFGFGTHQCLGQNLARMELQIVFDTLFRRIPNLKLAVPINELPFKDNATIYGVYELPVTW